MENSMKYMKLYENFQEKRPISDEDWKLFEEVNERFSKECWIRKKIIDNGDGTFDYKESLNLLDLKIKSLQEVIPLPIHKLYGDFTPANNIRNFIGCPKIVKGNFYGGGFEHITNLKGCPDYIGENFYCSECDNLTSLQGAPKIIKGIMEIKSNPIRSLRFIPDEIGEYLNIYECTSLLSFKYLEGVKFGGKPINYHKPSALLSLYKDNEVEMQTSVRIGGWEEPVPWKPDKKTIQFWINEGAIHPAIWFEALVYVGVRDFDAYVQVCKDFPEETKFTDEQVKSYLRSPLIDRKSTEEDWKVVKDILNRTKKYDHSEYRDSKLDSEWKDVF